MGYWYGTYRRFQIAYYVVYYLAQRMSNRMALLERGLERA